MTTSLKKAKKEKRIEQIMEELATYRQIRISALSQNLGVSRETIRRDLKELEKKGLLHYEHGGASTDTAAGFPYSALTSSTKNVEEKNAIAKYAADMIREHEVVVLLAGTTVDHMGPYLRKKENITVITNSLLLAQCVGKNQLNTVILLGGNFDAEAGATFGNATATEIQKYRTEKVFFSSSGISLKQGVTEYSSDYCQTAKEVLSISKKSILLADHTKFDLIGLHSICQVVDIDVVISDWKLPRKIISQYKKDSLSLAIAPKPEE